MSLTRIAVATTALALFPSLAAASDTPQSGYGVRPLSYPGMGATATLSNGDVVSFDGTTVELWTEAGGLITVIATFPSPVFASFVRISPDESQVLIGESSDGFLYVLDLSPSSLDDLVELEFNFDAVWEDDDNVIVSAASLGFGAGNQIYRVDVNTGATTLLAQVGGASGPVMIDGAGQLYYGTASSQFPAPVGGSDVLRWTVGQINGGVLLSEADASIVVAGLDGATSLAYDSTSDVMYIAENNFGSGTARIRQITGASPGVLLDAPAFQWVSNLEFTPGTGEAEYLPYQPAEGGMLRYNVTDFNIRAERNALEPLRPTLGFSGVGTTGAGPFDLDLADGPPNGVGILWYCDASRVPAVEMVVGNRIPLFLGLDPVTLHRVAGSVPVDPNGMSTQSYTNPGGLEGRFACQLLLFDVGGAAAGTSTVANL